MFSGGDSIAEWRVHNHNAAFGGFGNVDIINADTGTANHFQMRGGIQNIFCHLGRRADRQAVIIANDRRQLIW